MGRVVIGMDPHKASATIEVLDERERVLHAGQYGTDRDGYRQIRTATRSAADQHGRASRGSVGQQRVTVAQTSPHCSPETVHVRPGLTRRRPSSRRSTGQPGLTWRFPINRGR